MTQLEDIERIAPGVAGLTPDELEALQRFTLLWTLFEAQVLDNRASAGKIVEKVAQLAQLEGELFQKQLTYFSDRYIDNGRTNFRFDKLHLRRNDNPELVQAVLLGENVYIYDQLVACLIIVYRFRNNFFHGLKWAYGLKEQLDNFTQSTILLKKCLIAFPNHI